MKALRVAGALCLVALLGAALAQVWSRSGLSDWVWVLAVGHHIENYPDLRSFDVMAATLVTVLISAAIVRRILPAEPWRTKALRIVGTLCLVALLALVMTMACARSGIGDYFWVWAIGCDVEGDPDLLDVEAAVVMLASLLISAAVMRRILPVEPWRTQALSIVGTLCWVALLALAMAGAWGRSGINDSFWWAIGRDIEGYPDLMDVDVAVIMLVSVLISASIMRRILPVEASRTKALRIVGMLCVVGLLAQALGLAWYRSGLSDSVWVLATGRGLEDHPNMVDADFAGVTLLSVLISAAIVRRILQWRRAA